MTLKLETRVMDVPSEDRAPEKKEEPAAAGPVVVELASPIPAFDGMVKRIEFRRPTASDIITIGNPVVFDPFSDPVRVEHDPRKMTAMLARLSNVPSSSIAKMEPQDWVSCAWAISYFFLPRMGGT